jgi:hypothetical protein
MRLGSRVLITEEAAAEWRRARETESVLQEELIVLRLDELPNSFREEARCRGISPRELLPLILEGVFEAELLDSILDPRP